MLTSLSKLAPRIMRAFPLHTTNRPKVVKKLLVKDRITSSLLNHAVLREEARITSIALGGRSRSGCFWDVPSHDRFSDRQMQSGLLY